MDEATYRQLGLDLGMGDDTTGMSPAWDAARAHGNALVDWERLQSDHDPYERSPEGSARDEGAPEGTVTHHAGFRSRSYPGTTRDVWTYVPSMKYVPDVGTYGSERAFLQRGCNLLVRTTIEYTTSRQPARPNMRRAGAGVLRRGGLPEPGGQHRRRAGPGQPHL